MPLSGQPPEREVFPTTAWGPYREPGSVRRGRARLLDIRISEVCYRRLRVSSLTILESWRAAHDLPPALRGPRISRPRKPAVRLRAALTKRATGNKGIPVQLVTVDEAASLLACTPAAVRKWLAQRRLDRVKVGRLTRLRLEDIQRVSIEGLPKKGSVSSQTSLAKLRPK